MAKIKLEDIQQAVSELGWKVISEEYINLDTIMHFRCNEGHSVYSSWGKLRNKIVCPICKVNSLKVNKPTLISKQKDTIRVLSLDQASYNSGWAIYDNKELKKYGFFETGESTEIERFHSIKEWLISMIEVWQPDVVGIEGIQYQANKGVTTFQTLARLQGILMEVCFDLKIPFVICPTNTWRAHCKVKGKSRSDKKMSMKLIVKECFDISVNDDCADAIGIGKYVSETWVSPKKIISWE